MNATSQLPLLPKPRKRPAPSARDQEIYVKYQVEGRRQVDLAADYRLTQCRISQIIRRVDRWLSEPAIRDPQSAIRNPGDSAAAAQQLQRRLEYERVNFVCREAIRHFQQEQKTVTHKKGTRGDKSIDETTERVTPANVQYLKVALQATRQLVGWASPTTAPLEEHQAENDAAMREQFEAWLTKERDQAEREGKVSSDPNNHIVVRELVKAFLGEPHRGFVLHILARDANKKIVDRKPYDDTSPPLPQRDGWYAAVHDEDGDVIGWRPADAATGDIAVKGCGHGGDVGQASRLPEKGGQASGDGTAQQPQSANTSTTASAAAAQQTAADNELGAKPSTTKISDNDWNHPRPPPDPSKLRPGEKPKSPFDDPEERRRRHLQRLEQLREARRTGRFHSFTFYPEDGPMPPPPSYVVDGAPPPRS